MTLKLPFQMQISETPLRSRSQTITRGALRQRGVKINKLNLFVAMAELPRNAN